MDGITHQRSPRREGGRNRDGAGDRRHTPAPGNGRLQMDRNRAGDWRRNRNTTGLSTNDSGSATHSSQPRVRSSLRHSGRQRRILPAYTPGAPFHDVGSFDGGDFRLTHFYRQPDGSGKTAGGPAPGPPHIQGSKFFESAPAGGCDFDGAVSVRKPRREATLSSDAGNRPGV